MNENTVLLLLHQKLSYELELWLDYILGCVQGLLVSGVELLMYLMYRFLPKKAEERRKIILTVWKKGYSEDIFINFFKKI